MSPLQLKLVASPAHRWSRLDGLAASSAATLVMDGGTPSTPSAGALRSRRGAPKRRWASPSAFSRTSLTRRSLPAGCGDSAYTMHSLLSVAAAHQAGKVQPAARTRVCGFPADGAAPLSVGALPLAGRQKPTPAHPCTDAPASKHECAEAGAAADGNWAPGYQAALASRMACVLSSMPAEDARCLAEARAFLATF